MGIKSVGVYGDSQLVITQLVGDGHFLILKELPYFGHSQIKDYYSLLDPFH